ncbi:hypothetical protein [Actinoplanes rectilineatus]|uniref:hypothetical protein n=1 Tax=Actinoplanes rectilineatus TaxID=113571 RepID=UPI0012F81991|nr:hypothetical protein [Actinoplanes rectilineatus]
MSVHHARFPRVCSLCDRVVLGLPGHDWLVEPYAVARDDVLPGFCHVSCLSDLGIAADWADAVSDHYRTRWPVWIAGDGWRLHYGQPRKAFHLWGTNARMLDVGAPALFANTAVALLDIDVEGPLTGVLETLRLTDRYPLIRGGEVTRRRVNAGTARRPEWLDLTECPVPLLLDPAILEAARSLTAAR